MSTRFVVSLCDTNDRANGIVDNFLNTCYKFDSVDIMGASRFGSNFSKNHVRKVEDLPILRSQFQLSYNMHLMGCYVEESYDLPKNNCYNQNLAEVNNVVVLCNGTIRNKEYVAHRVECSIGQCDQEFIANLYIATLKKNLRENIIPSMIRDIEADSLSFVIFDKNLNEIYVYNRGDSLYINNLPGTQIVISSDILPIGSTYPHYNYHKLPSNTCIKIDTKTMFVQYLPVHSNTFSFGKSVLVDPSKALLYTEACDMQYYVASALLSNRDIYNGTDVHTIYFGFDTEIDDLIVDRLVKVRKSLSIPGKLPLHVRYSFENIYKSESEAIDELNQKEDESIEGAREEKKASNTSDNKKKARKIPSTPSLRDTTMFMNRKINFIASSLVNLALENGCGTIFIPNTNKRNNRLISTIKDIINSQVVSPLYVISILDQYNTMDLIRYILVCREMKDAPKLLINCDRSSINIDLCHNGNKKITYDVSSNYNYDTICAFSKCGIENPFNDMYVGREKINNLLINANIMPDKLFDNQMKVSFVDSMNTITKNHVEYQRKILSF